MYKNFASLSTLIRSKAKRNILKELILSPTYPLSLRELARRVHLNVNAVAYALEHLEKVQIVTKRKFGKKYLYSFNKDHPFALSIIDLFHKSYGLGYILFKQFYSDSTIDFIILTHFFIENKARGEYDVEVLFIGTPQLLELNQIMENVENTWGKPIAFTVLSPEDTKLRLKRADQFLMGILSHTHVFVKGDITRLLKLATP